MKCNKLGKFLLVYIKKSVQWNKLNLLSKAVYVSEQVCIGWCRTGAYYSAKRTFSHDFPIQVWGAYYIQIFTVCHISGAVL